MKAKAMKKTLSCILALSLTASMMAENLTAIAANDGFGGTNIAGAQPGTLEEDKALPAGAIVVSSATDLTNFNTVWTEGTSKFLANAIADVDEDTFLRVKTVSLVDGNGAAITAGTDIFVDGALEKANVDKALSGYYAKFNFQKVSPTTTSDNEKVIGYGLAVTDVTGDVYVSLDKIGYDSGITSTGATYAAAKVAYGLHNAVGDAATSFAGNQTDVTTGKVGQILAVCFPKLGFKATASGNATEGYTNVQVVLDNTVADGDTKAGAASNEATVDVYRRGVEAIQVNLEANADYYQNSLPSYAFKNATFQLKWNDETGYRAAVSFVDDNGKLIDGLKYSTNTGANYYADINTGLTTAGATTIQFKYAPDPTATKGFVGETGVTAEALPITIQNDAIDTVGITSVTVTETTEGATTTYTGKGADKVAETAAVSFPVYTSPFDLEKFYTGENAFKFTHKNGRVDYLIAVPTFNGGALTTVKWYKVNYDATYSTAETKNKLAALSTYFAAYKNAKAEQFLGDQSKNFNPTMTGNFTPIIADNMQYVVPTVDFATHKVWTDKVAVKVGDGDSASTLKQAVETAYIAWGNKAFNDVTTGTAYTTEVGKLKATDNETYVPTFDNGYLRLGYNETSDSVTVSYMGGVVSTGTNSIAEKALFDWDTTSATTIEGTQVYTGGKFTDLVNDESKIVKKKNTTDATTAAAAFITKGGTDKAPAYTIQDDHAVLIVERKKALKTNEDDKLTVVAVYSEGAVTDALLPEAINKSDSNYMYTYEMYAVNSDATFAVGNNIFDGELAQAKYTNPITIKIAEDALASSDLTLAVTDDIGTENIGKETDIPVLKAAELEAVDANQNATKFYTGPVVLKVTHSNGMDQFLVSVPSFNTGTGALDGAYWFALDDNDANAAIIKTYVDAYTKLKKTDKFSVTALEEFCNDDGGATVFVSSAAFEAPPAFVSADGCDANKIVTDGGKYYRTTADIEAGSNIDADGSGDNDNAVEITKFEAYASLNSLNFATVSNCAFDVAGSEDNINVVYNKAGATVTVTYRDASKAFSVAPAAAFDFNADAKAALKAVEVYPRDDPDSILASFFKGDSIFDVFADEKIKVTEQNAGGGEDSNKIIDTGNTNNPKIYAGYTIIITQTKTTTAGAVTESIVGVYDSTCTAEADVRLPAVPEDGDTYTYKVSVVKGAKADYDTEAEKTDLLNDRKKETRTITETTLVDLDLKADSIKTVALANATTDGLSNAASSIPSVKYGEDIITGSAAVKVTHANGVEEYLIAVPDYVYADATDGYSLTTARIVWYGVPVDPADTAVAEQRKKDLNTFLKAYTDFGTALAAADAKTETADVRTAAKAALADFDTAITTFTDKYALWDEADWAGTWTDTTGAVAQGKFIAYKGKVYIVNTALTADDDTENEFLAKVNEFIPQSDFANRIEGYKGAFAATKEYAIGDVVINPTDGKLYEFTADHVAGDWVANQVEALPFIVTGAELDATVTSAAQAAWKNKGKLHINLDTKQNPGTVAFTYREKTSENIPVTVSGATVGAIQGEIGARVTDKNQTKKYNASYVLKMTPNAGEQRALPTDAKWEVPAAGNALFYSVPTATDTVFYFNYSTSFTDDELIATIKEGDASITYQLNDGEPITKDLKTGLTDGTFGVISETPISAAGAQWLGFWYKDTTNADATAGTTYTKVNFYLPVFVGNNLKEPVIKTKTAVQKYYYKGETFNPNGIKVDLKDYYSYQIADKDADLELKDLDAKYWSVYFNNGVTKTPSVADGVVNAALTAASVAARIGSIVVYNAAADICGFTVNAGSTPGAELKFTENYVKTISIDVDNIKSKYQVGYYPDNTILHQATLPTVEKITKGAILKVSFANKAAQADVEIPFSTFVAPDELGGTMHVKKVLTGGKTLEGDIIVTALSGVTTGGKATPGKNATYRVTFVPGNGPDDLVNPDENDFVSDDTIAPVTVTVSTEQVAIKSVGLYDGTTIAADDYYVEANPAATADGAEKCTPTTQFYVGERVNADTVTRGFDATRVQSNNTGSFLVTYTDGKKQLVPYNAYGVEFPTVDSSTEQASRKVSFTYEVEEQKGYYEGYKTVAPIELNVSILQDEILSFDVNENQGIIVFYQGDTDRTLFEHIKEADDKVVAIDDDDEYFITAVYKNRGEVRNAFDLLDSTEFRHFTYADSDFDTITATTGRKTLTYTYSQNGKDVELKLPIEVLEKPVDLTIKNPTRTVFEKTEVVSLDGGALTLEIGGQDSVKKTFTLNDILSNSDELGDYKGRFQVVDDKNNVITDKTISNLGDGYHTLTFKFYRTVPNDENKVATATLNVSLIDAYVSDLYLDPATTDTSTLLTSYVGSPINFKDHAIKYTMSDALSTAKTLNLATVPIYSTDEDGNPTQTIINGVAKSSLTGILKNAYMTVTTEVKQKNGTTKIVTDYGDKTKNVFGLAGTHHVHIQLDDKAIDFDVDVKAVVPTAFTLTGGTAPKYGDASGNQYVGQELAFTAGTGTVKFIDGTTKTVNLATDKNIFIHVDETTGNPTFDKDTLGLQHVQLDYVVDGTTVTTASGELDITVLADTVSTVALTVNGSAVSSTNPITFYVGDTATAFNEYQNIGATFTMKSGATIKVDNVAKSDLNKYFSFTALTDTKTTTEIPLREMSVKYGKDAASTITVGTVYYQVETDDLATVTPTANTYFDEGSENKLKTSVYKVGNATIKGDGFYFDATFESGRKAKKIDLGNLPTGYTIAILKADGTQVVADTAKATAAEKALLTAGVYVLGINYSAKNGDNVKSKALDKALPLVTTDATGAEIAGPKASVTYVAATAYAKTLAVTTAPGLAFGNSKAKITVNQYSYPNADAFVDDLKIDQDFAITAYADNDTTGFATGKKGAWDGWTFDASGIDFTKDSPNYTLKVTYQDVTASIPVTVEARTIKSLTEVQNNRTITLGVGEIWDGTYDDDNIGVTSEKVTLQIEYSDGTPGAVIDLAKEIELGEKSKVDIDYDTSDAGAAKIIVTYEGATCTLDATVVEPTALTALNFLVKPDKLTYKRNEKPVLDGAIVVGTFGTNDPLFTYDAIVSLSALKDLTFEPAVLADNVAGDWVVHVGKFDWSWIGGAEENLEGDIDILDYATAKQTEKDKKFVREVSTPKSINVKDAQLTYYLKYTGKYAKNTADNRLIVENGLTDRTIPAKDKVEKIALSKSAIESQVFDATKGTLTISYLDSDTDQVIPFENNVSGSTGASPIRVKINGIAEATPTLPTAEGTYGVEVSYYETADVTAAGVKTTSYTLNVAQDEVTGFTLTPPDDTEVIQGGAINLTGAKAELIFKSGRKVDPIQLTDPDLGKMFKISKVNQSLVDQKQTITVQYYEYDEDGNEIAVGTPAEFEITLKKNIARSISIYRRPKNKFIYNTSDTDYNFEGGELEVTWEKAIDEEGNKTQIFKMDELYADKTSGFEVEAVDFTEAVTDKVITISYLGQKTTFLLTVDPDPITGIKESTKDPITKKIALDSKIEDFVKTGSVVISYELGEDKEVKLSDEHIKIEGWDVSKPQEVDLYITYTEGKYKSEKLKVTVAVGMNVVTGITFDDDTSAKTVKLTVGDTLTLADYSLKIAYEDAEAKTTTLANADGLLTVTAYKVDGETETLVDAIDTSAVGTYKIKAVSSEDKTSKAGATLTVEVEAVKVGEIKPANEVIRITTKDDLSLEAEKVTVKYTSGAGSTAELTLGTNTKIAYTITDASGNAVEKINPETEGTYTVKITSKEDTTYAGAEITVIVSDTTITDFKLSETAKTINKGDTLSLAGITATVTYSKGEPKSYDLATATAKELKVDTSAVKTSEPGTYNVVVTLWEDPSKTATIAVTVTDVKVKSIEVADVTLTDGKKFDPAAIDAKITLDDAAATTETVKLNSTKLSYTIADATGAAVTEIDPTKAATYTVTVKSTVDAAFAGATFKVTVSVVTITDAKLTPPAKLEFKTGEVVGYGDAKMTVTYSDNTTKEFKLADGTGLTITITDAAGTEIEDITKIDTTKAGVYTVKVSVTGDNRVPESFTITIVDANKITDEDIEIPEETPTIDSRVVTFTKNGDSWTQGAGAATLTDAFKAIGNGNGDYMFVVSGNITEESALKLPSKATGITIVGEGTVTLKKPTTFNVKTANISINCPISGTLNVTVGRDKTLKVGENVKALGAIKGDATSKIDFIGEGAVTVGSISKAAEVYAESGRVITMSGSKAKVQNVAKIKAEFALSDGAAISSSAFEEGIVTIKGEKTKVTITGATTKFLDIIIDAEDKALTSGTAVLFGNGRFDPSTNVVIRNKDSEGNKLSAVAYNKNKEVRAENIELISYTIGEDGEEQNISSFEALFDKLNTITGDVFVTLNGDAEISKSAKYPTKFTGKLSIDGNGYKINSLGLSAFAPKGDLAIKNLAALTVKGENKFVVKGLKNKTLTLEDNSAEFAQITGFTNVVADSVIVTNKFQVTNLTLSGLFVVQNTKAAVTVENLTIVDDGAFGFVATDKKQKTITVKKTVTKDADAKVVFIMVTKSGDVYEEDDTKSMATGATVFTDSAKKLALTDVDATGLKAGGTGSVSVRNGKFTVA